MATRETTPESNEQMLRSLAQQMEDQTRRVEHEKEDGKPEKTQKILFGLFDIPSSLAPIWDFASNFVQPRIRLWGEQGVRNYGDRLFGKHTSLAANTLGWTYTFASPIQGAVQAFFTEKGEFRDLQKRLAPVMEGLGKTSFGNNEIMDVEKKRINMHFKKNFITDVGSATVAAIPQAVLKFRDDKKLRTTEADNVLGKMSNESDDDYIKRQVEQITKVAAEEQRISGTVHDRMKIIKKDIEAKYPDMEDYEKRRLLNRVESRIYDGLKGRQEKEESKVSDETVNYLGSALSGVGAVTFRKAFERQSDHTIYKETALDKIEELCKHIDDQGVEALSVDDLSGRIQDIFNAHQLNMGQREVRQVDREDFERASRQIAEAITNFELDPMGLVLLVGNHGADKDRLILKKQGKQIATFDETESAIKQVSELMPARAHIDPHKFEQELGITAEKQKAIVAGLPAGAVKDYYISELPQTVAKLHGIEDKEYVEIKTRTKPSQDANRRLALLDLLVMPDDVLKSMNLKEEQIAKIREVGEEAIDGGSKPVKDAVSKAKLDGIEMLIVGAGAYWDKFISGELKEIGQLWRQLSPKYMEERETKRAEEAKERRREEEDERKAEEHDEDKGAKRSKERHSDERDEEDKKYSRGKTDDREHDEIKDERFPKISKSKGRDAELDEEEDKPVKGRSSKRELDMDMEEEERPADKRRKVPSSLLAKGKRDLDTSLSESATRDL